ncbi:MAG TPA: hypothetical protein VF170_10930, partial [Planctomycetaceae bacterium]
MSDARRSPPGPASAATGPRAKPPPDADSATPGDTIAAPPSRESPRTNDSIAFPSAILGEYDDLLSPPEAAGELGRLGGYRILR